MFNMRSFSLVLLVLPTVLSWASTYSGIYDFLIGSSRIPESNSSHIMVMVGVGLLVALLQFMIIFVLNLFFDLKMRKYILLLSPIVVLFYAFFTSISIGFGFGFWWKIFGAPQTIKQEMEGAISHVQYILGKRQKELDNIKVNLRTLSNYSAKMASQENSKGGTCRDDRGSVSTSGDGPRKYLRNNDAQKFMVYSNIIASAITKLNKNIQSLEKSLDKIRRDDVSTRDKKGEHTVFISKLNNGLERFIRELNDWPKSTKIKDIREKLFIRSSQIRFKRTVGTTSKIGKTFICYDTDNGRLKDLIKGVVMALDQFPQTKRPPKIPYLEGSQAVVESFARLKATAMGIFTGDYPPSPSEFRKLRKDAQKNGKSIKYVSSGIGRDDLIPLLLAIFIDLCIFLISMYRGFTKDNKPASKELIKKLNGAYGRHMEKIPNAKDRETPLMAVIFQRINADYAAVPQDFTSSPNKDYPQKIGRSVPKWVNPNSSSSPSKSKKDKETPKVDLCEAPYIEAAYQIFERENFVYRIGWFGRLVRGITKKTVSRKLKAKGSKYESAASFVIYKFYRGAYSDISAALSEEYAEPTYQQSPTSQARPPLDSGEEIRTQTLPFHCRTPVSSTENRVAQDSVNDPPTTPPPIKSGKQSSRKKPPGI